MASLTKIRAHEIQPGGKLAVAGRPIVSEVVRQSGRVLLFAEGRSFEYRDAECIGIEREAFETGSEEGRKR